MVKEAIETVVAVVSKQQDYMEKRNEARINSLHEQLGMITSLLKSSSQSSPHQLSPTPTFASLPAFTQRRDTSQKFTCDMCKKSFDTERSKKNHVRNDSQPKT